MTSHAIAERLGLAKSTVAYHLRRLEVPADERFRRRYDWAAIQAFYDEGRTVRECIEHFGFSAETWHAARRRGDIVTPPNRMPIDELLSRRRNRSHLRARLAEAGLLPDRCEVCGINEWRGATLALHLHHINGIGEDNSLENLQVLCPNCHSQTENFSGRNKGRRHHLTVVDERAKPTRPDGSCAPAQGRRRLPLTGLSARKPALP